jgi:uncharacterized protein (PEP-CTERM system associated)
MPATWRPVALALLATAVHDVAHAERWTNTVSVGGTETYNHYTGAGQPSDGAVTSLTGAVAFDGEGARAKLKGTLSGTAVIYAAQGQADSFAPTANVLGQIEAIEKFFWIDATVNVSQSYVSPFGPQPANLTTPTSNRYTSETYSVSPYIKSNLGSQVAYSVRDDSTWTASQDYGNSVARPPNTYWNSFDALLSSITGGPAGWSGEYTRQYYNSNAEIGNYTLQTFRGIVSYRLDPQLEVSARGGYDKDRFPTGSTLGNSTQGSFYGGGVHWVPTERTDVNGYWEQHYYGSSYSLTATHRLPNVALNAAFTRGFTSYPQTALLIPAGVPVAQFLDAAFATRIPDPVQRAAAVAQFLAQSGLPPTLLSPLNVYATSITLSTIETLGAVWVGKLNSIGVVIFRAHNEAVSGKGTTLPEAFAIASDYVETGGSVNYSYRLSGLTNFVATASYVVTTPHVGDQTTTAVRTRNYNASAALNTSFSPKTTGAVGLTYFIFDTEGVSGRSSTLSLFASISHTF